MVSKTFKILLILIFFFFSVSFCDELTGYEVMAKSFYRDDGQDAYFKVEMVLEDKKGSIRERVIDNYTKDYGQLLKTFLRFLEPADIKGTAFLTWENDGTDDTQYLYLPELGRVRRIVSSQKSLRFVNTDFTYEDMQRRLPDKDEHSFVGYREFMGWECYVVESIPKNKKSSQYSMRRSFIEKETFMVVKVDFYDKKDKLVKELQVVDRKQIGGIWTAIVTTMEDLKENHKTTMRVLEAKYNLGVEDEKFSLRSLHEN